MQPKSNREYISEYNSLCQEGDLLYHSIASSLGLSDCAFWILYTLYNTRQPFTQKDFCESLFMTQQTVNSALKKLEQGGYLRLERVSGKPGKYIYLTEKGTQFARERIAPFLLAEENACSNLSEEEKAAFLNTMRSFIRGLRLEVDKLKN